MGAHAVGSMLASVDAQALASLMAEVDDPVLQLKVVRLAAAAAAADGHLAEGEDVVLSAASRYWGPGQQGRPLTTLLSQAPHRAAMSAAR